MRKSVFFFVILLFVSGCATRPPASCDGSQRRPINGTSHASYFPSCGAEVA